ncbi:MAG: PEP/pyruvate-binding domain-containing protein [Nanoarchaeota archaeon]
MALLIPQEETNAPLDLVGGKGRGLLKLKSIEDELNYWEKRRVEIPPFFVVPPSVDLSDAFHNILDAAKSLEARSYAVRSSSPLEDVGEYSFDGIFRTDTDVPLEKIVRSVHEVRKSALSGKARAYASEVGLDLDGRMPVVVQAMAEDRVDKGIVYSKFPSPHNIAKVVRGWEDSESTRIDAYKRIIRPNKTHYPGVFPFLFSGGDTSLGSEPYMLAELALEVEGHMGFPIIMEYVTVRIKDAVSLNLNVRIIQARKLSRLSEAEKFQIPELQKKGLVANTYSVNGVGEFTGKAYVAYRHDMDVEMLVDGLPEFDEAHKDEGYVLITPHIRFYGENIDEISPHKKAVVAYQELGEHHDFEIARAKGLLYLNCHDLLSFPFFRARRREVTPPIKTGETVRVVSDGAQGYVFNLSRAK